MTLDFFASQLNNPVALIPAILKEWKTNFEEKAYVEYNPEYHKVNSRIHRPNKLVNRGNGVKDASGNEVTQLVEQPVNRISIPKQKLIVSRQVAFLTGGGTELAAQVEKDSDRDSLYKAVKATWKANKLDFKNGDLATRLLSETEVVEIWYEKEKNDGSSEMRFRVFSPSMGYNLVPVWNEYGDLMAFGLGWREKDENDRRRTIEILEVYTESERRIYKKINGIWSEDEGGYETLRFGKIPAIYYSIERSAWADVQSMIDRFEKQFSNVGDINDYFASPMLVAQGRVLGLAAKGETGKVVEVEENADIKYLTWDSVPEAIKYELESLREMIFSSTQTPDITFEQMKGLGDISGVAFDRVMIDAHLMARARQQGSYGEGIQRRLNFLATACAMINGLESANDLEITPVFGLFNINDERGKIENMQLANGGKPVISHKESVVKAGLTEDPDETYRLIVEDERIEEENGTNRATSNIQPRSDGTASFQQQ